MDASSHFVWVHPIDARIDLLIFVHVYICLWLQGHRPYMRGHDFIDYLPSGSRWQPECPNMGGMFLCWYEDHGPISQMVCELIIQILAKFQVTFMWIIMVQSSHNFAHAMTAQLSWHVQTCDMIGSIQLKLKQYEFSQDFNFKLKPPCEMVSRELRVNHYAGDCLI